MEISELQKQINGIDSSIAELLLKRFEITNLIGEIKAQNGIAVFNPAREREILEGLKSGRSAEQCYIIETLYNEIFKLSRQLQQQATPFEEENI